MDLKHFKTLRRNYGAFPAMRILICQTANVDVFQADKHLGELLDEHPIGKIERMTSKELFQIAEDIVEVIRSKVDAMLPLVEKRFIETIFAKS
jgi:hypothetical protein